MSDDPYRKLRKFLDSLPLGFPKTDSNVEIKILKRLFTEEEAKIATYLSPIPMTPKQIARKIKMEKEELEEKLHNMSLKGLIFRVKREGKVYYNTAPYMIGLYEYSVKKVDKELAKLFKKYFEEAYLDELGSSNVPGFKVIPIEETIEPKTTLYPYHKLKESIRKARKISVTECICRKESRLLSEGCDYPLETCLSFGAAAQYYIENAMGREIDAEEAIEILEMADKAGLVHAGVNTKHLSNICNCCPCCCASMKGITQFNHDKHRYMNALFKSVIDHEKCVKCEVCVERCPVKAIDMKEFPVIDFEKCLGCGLCATTCPQDAIKLELRENREEPFDRVLDLGMSIIKAKKSNQKGKTIFNDS